MKNSKDDLIHIGSDWALGPDQICVTVFKRRITKKGKVQWDAVSYHNNTYDALQWCVDKEISIRSDIDDIIKGIDDLKKWIKEAWDAIKKHA